MAEDELPEDAPMTFLPIIETYASTFQVGALGDEFSLTCSAPRLGSAKTEDGTVMMAQARAVASIILSPLGLKDLSLLMQRAVKDYENEHGVIATSYTRRLAEQGNLAK